MERAVDAGLPAAMLAEQYRMHPDICTAISATFYAGKLRTGAGMAACRPAVPACRLLDVNGQEKQHPGAGFSNRQEAEALIEAAVAAARELEGLVSREAVGCGCMWRQAKHIVRTAKDEQLCSCVVHERHPLVATIVPALPPCLQGVVAAGHTPMLFIVCLYNRQRGLMLDLLNERRGWARLKPWDVAVLSADACQGSEADAVLVSTVRNVTASNSSGAALSRCEGQGLGACRTLAS